ncbi:MAG: PQQ-binding-like beta-propeller repeat protein [Deltaproteobacteria bacterium]|nr:PQQ-binding-like beta-propeller repeat protein [Deltaproteobacteria bacterium]
MPRIYWAISSYLIIPFILLNLGCSSLSIFGKGRSSVEVVEKKPRMLPWGMYLLNRERLATTEDSLSQPLDFYWSFRITSVWKLLPQYRPIQHSSPAVVDNIAYIGSAEKGFYALDIKEKKVLWVFPTQEPVESSPAVSPNRVYFGTTDGTFYCVDIKNGREVWKFQAKTEILSSPLVVEDLLYFTSIDDRIYALKAATGEKVWHYSKTSIKKVTRRLFASLAFSNGRLYGILSDGDLVALDASSGREVWRKRVTSDTDSSMVRSTPTIEGGLIYVINRDMFLVALDGDKGEEKWRFDITKVVDFAIKKNTVFLINPEGQVFAVNKVTGELLWRRKVTKGNPVSVIYAGNYLVVASRYSSAFFDIELLTSTEGYIDIFTDKGEKVWSEKTDSGISTTPVVAYNQLLFVTDKGHLNIYKARN